MHAERSGDHGIGPMPPLFLPMQRIAGDSRIHPPITRHLKIRAIRVAGGNFWYRSCRRSRIVLQLFGYPQQSTIFDVCLLVEPAKMMLHMYFTVPFPSTPSLILSFTILYRLIVVLCPQMPAFRKAIIRARNNTKLSLLPDIFVILDANCIYGEARAR